jgi:hypothetical protein
MSNIHSIFKALFLSFFVTTSLQAQYSIGQEAEIVSYVESCLDGASNTMEESLVQTFHNTSSKTYVVEMLGKRGTLKFDQPISSRPKQGLISLKKGSQVANLNITISLMENGLAISSEVKYGIIMTSQRQSIFFQNYIKM